MLKKYPFTKQESLKDCAAASVSMIIKYYKGYIPLSKINEMLKTTKNGTTAYHIIETLKQIGFTAQGLKVDKLEKTHIPFIANVQVNSYKHFLVVYEVTDKYVLIADPAKEITKQKIEDFLKIWTNIKIIMHPVKTIPKQKKVSLKTIITIIKPSRKTILQLFGLSCIITLSSIFGSFFFQSLLENLKTKKYSIELLSTIFFASYLINLISNFLRGKLIIKFSNKMEKSLNIAAFKQIILLPYTYYHNHTAGEIISKLNDLKVVREIISKTILTLLVDIPLSLITGIILFYLNKTLFLIVIITIILYLIIIFLYNKPLKRQIEKVNEAKVNLNSYMTESLNGFETIKGLNLETKIINNWNKYNDEYIKHISNLQTKINNQIFLKDLINITSSLITIIVGIILIKQNLMSVETLITYIILISLFLNPVRNIIDLDFEIKEGIITIRRVLELIATKEKEKPYHNGDIFFQNVNYSFDEQTYTLENINLIIKEKEKVLITGKSGSGKSTLMKLLKGYYKDYTGIIKIGNQDLKIISPKINYISLNETIFTGTIEYNLKIKNTKNLKQIKEICQTDTIIKDDLNYSTLLEENGLNLSAGQRQKITLARSLQDFDILIIDEALNALDTNQERQILKSLLQSYKNKTIIFISHRLENLDLFDKYIVLEKGKVILNETKAY